MSSCVNYNLIQGIRIVEEELMTFLLCVMLVGGFAYTAEQYEKSQEPETLELISLPEEQEQEIIDSL
jgi:hypothetical protein